MGIKITVTKYNNQRVTSYLIKNASYIYIDIVTTFVRPSGTKVIVIVIWVCIVLEIIVQRKYIKTI